MSDGLILLNKCLNRAWSDSSKIGKTRRWVSSKAFSIDQKCLSVTNEEISGVNTAVLAELAGKVQVDRIQDK